MKKKNKRKEKMKLNKWVKENGKWVEYKCVKPSSDKKKDIPYMNVLKKAIYTLNDIDIHYLINTLEDVLDSKKYKRYEE